MGSFSLGFGSPDFEKSLELILNLTWTWTYTLDLDCDDKSSSTGVVGPQLFADYAVLDGDLTLSLSPAVTAATGVDAMVHAIEAFTSKHKKNVLSDVLAKEALKLLTSNIR